MPLFDRPPVQHFPDRAFHEALEQVQNLRDVLFQAVPDVASRLDFDHAEYIKPAFLLEDWRRRESDLLCLIPYRPPGAAERETVLICVLLEHQSRPDPHMPLRVLLYAVLLWEQQWKEYERSHELGTALRLTPVVPIVFHTGARSGRATVASPTFSRGPRDSRRMRRVASPLLGPRGGTPEALLAADGPFAQFLAICRQQSDAERFQQICADSWSGWNPVAGQDKMRWRDLLWLLFSWVSAPA